MDLYVGLRICGLAAGANSEPQWLSDQEPAAAVEALLHPAARRRTLLAPRVRVWLSGALARPFVMRPVQGLRRASEAEALAAQAAHDAGMEFADPALWLSDSLLQHASVAVAADRALLRHLLGLVSGAGLKLSQLSPWWRLALDMSLKQHATQESLLIQDTDGVAWFNAPKGEWSAAEYRLARRGTNNADLRAPDTKDAEQEAWIARRLFAAGVAASSVTRLRLERGGVGGSEGWPQVVHEKELS